MISVNNEQDPQNKMHFISPVKKKLILHWSPSAPVICRCHCVSTFKSILAFACSTFLCSGFLSLPLLAVSDTMLTHRDTAFNCIVTGFSCPCLWHFLPMAPTFIELSSGMKHATFKQLMTVASLVHGFRNGSVAVSMLPIHVLVWRPFQEGERAAF